MALFDDKRFLLSHIRHSFITGDDTGVCEAVMLNEILPHRNKYDDDYSLLEELMIETKSELENAQSFDIVSNMDIFGSHRRRSNTAQRLERLRLDKKNKSKVKVVRWANQIDNQSINDQDLDYYFPVKDVQKLKLERDGAAKRKSLLSKQMQRYPTAPVNPFNEYSKFDARISETNGNSKRLTIYLTMLNEEERKKPLYVEVVNTAKIQELIGLICWQFTNIQEGKEPLKSNVSHYCLRIAEENGEVDPDFPCLNANELVSKFGFPILALEERKIDEESSPWITIHIDQVFTKIEPSVDATMEYVLNAVMKKRKDILDAGKNYVLKSMNGLDEIDLSSKLSEMKEKEFRLVPAEEKSVNNDLTVSDASELPDLQPIEATLYKCYNVLALQKYSNDVEVQLGISGKKVDVTPYSNPNVKQAPNKFASKFKIFQTKPTSFNVENIMECLIVPKAPDQLPEDRSLFKISYSDGHGKQTLKFECNTDTANKIVKKINYLMEMRNTGSKTRGDWAKSRK